MLLALDPSITKCGVVLFDDGILVRAGIVKITASKENILRRVVLMAFAVQDWVSGAWIHEVAAEWPPTYTGAKEKKGGAAVVVPLAGVCGAVCAALGVDNATSYLPSEWTGQVPKIETVNACKLSPRAIKIKARLSTSELRVWVDQVKYHDTIDAIGVGLHHLGRYDRKRVWGRG